MLKVVISAAFIYMEPTFENVDSEVIYGTDLKVVGETDRAYLVITPEEDKGWIRKVAVKEAHQEGHISKINSLWANVFREANVFKEPIIQLPYGSKVSIIDETDKRWLKMKLLDGRIGWIQRGDLSEDKTMTLDEALALSKRFFETPYTWGGGTANGIDCSGLTQLIFREMGIKLPHSARLQQKMGAPVSKESLQKGDLIFFAYPENGKVVHVGIYLGNDQFIHSQAKVGRPGGLISVLSEEPWKGLYHSSARFSFPESP